MPYRTLGIDLGTTNSVTVWMDGGVPVVLPNRHGEQATVSAVGTGADGSLLVGSEALGVRDHLPGSVITEVKRLIGRRHADADVQRLLDERPADAPPVRESTDGGVEIRLGAHWLTPVQISAILLRRLRTDAENTAGEPFPRAVITVPAYFTEPQYAAVREAGELAGFTVARILPEPTAAAHAFGVERLVEVEEDDMCSVLVYDLGGGTFDVSLLIIGSGYFKVYKLGGDKSLGGADFDSALCRMLTEKRLGGRDLSGTGDAARIRAAAERTKIELSDVTAAEIILAPLGQNGGSWTGKITRDDFEELIGAEIDRTLELTRGVLRDASRTAEDIDKVLLVGGSTRIPLVRRRLAELFGEEKVHSGIDPMSAVALGAGIEAGLASGLACPSEPCLTTGIPLTESACPDCGASLRGTATVDCTGCHVPAAEGTMSCPVCADDLSELRAAAPVASRASCPHCGEQNSTSSTMCQLCDEPLDAGGLKCPNPKCQMVNATGLTACSACDALFQTDQPEQVTAQNLGLALNDGTVAVVFPAGTTYPTTWRNIEDLQVRPDGATALTFRFIEGPHEKSHERNEFCGQHTQLLSMGSGSAERLELRARIDENRTLHLAYRVGDREEQGVRLRRSAVSDGIGRDAAHLLEKIRTHVSDFGDELKAAERDAFTELAEQLTAIVRGEPLCRSLDGFLDEARDTVETCRDARGWSANASIAARRGRELGLGARAEELADARRALDAARERHNLPALRAATEHARSLWRQLDITTWRSMLAAHDAELGRFPESVRRPVLTAWDDLRAAVSRGDYAAQDALHVKLNELAGHSQAPTAAARNQRDSAQVFPERR
ncbi:Hsp70 family protein [Streptomyces sp. NPDC000594]|uniref:Hsp70 family protein n=1 Tax=Streptomyces sp. NPDC000594 TaxID=3154261 RepID=UPI003330C591